MPPTRFATDASLELVARRLRMLGYDVVTHRGARLVELFDVAAREARTVLTLSPRRPRAWAHVPTITLPPGDAAAAVRQIASAHEPGGPPFGRCPVCNTRLMPRSAFEARGEVPPRVTRAGWPLHYCPGCGKWYWPGTHHARLKAWLENALGRPLGELSGPDSAAGLQG